MAKDPGLGRFLDQGGVRAGRRPPAAEPARPKAPRRTAQKIDEAELAHVRRAVAFLNSRGYSVSVPEVIETAIRRHMAELARELNDGQGFPEIAPAPSDELAQLGYGQHEAS